MRWSTPPTTESGATWWHSATSWSHGIKGGNTDEAFQALQEQRFLLRRRSHTLTFYMYKNRYAPLKERVETKKHNRHSTSSLLAGPWPVFIKLSIHHYQSPCSHYWAVLGLSPLDKISLSEQIRSRLQIWSSSVDVWFKFWSFASRAFQLTCCQRPLINDGH